MKRTLVFCSAILLLICAYTQAQPIPDTPAKIDVEPVLTTQPVLGSGVATVVTDPWLDPVYVAGKLSEVPPLTKPHLTWPRFFTSIWERNEPAVREHARVTKAVGYPLDYIDSTSPSFNILDDLVDEYNAMPFAFMEPYVYPIDNTWTGRTRNLDFTPQGFFNHLEYIRMAIDVYKQSSRHTPQVILFDTECLNGCQGNYEDDVVVAKLNIVYGMFKSEFPDAQILWFCQGCRGWKSDYYGWSKACTVPPTALGDGFSAGLYTPEERYFTRQTYKKVCEWADEYGVHRVVPWLSFGYHTTYSLQGTTWSLVPPFGHGGTRGPWDNFKAWELGWEINRQKPVRAETDWPDWDRADFTCGWPSAYNGADLRTGYWENLYWYARGAADMR